LASAGVAFDVLLLVMLVSVAIEGSMDRGLVTALLFALLLTAVNIGVLIKYR
jgi:hypothetical protein